MKVVLQRVSRASVRCDGTKGGSIGTGLVVLIGVAEDDTDQDVHRMVDKILTLRIMADEEGKMNCSVTDVRGELLIISQFTLLADTTGGRRPFFGNAAAPGKAEELYDRFVDEARSRGVSVQTGEFGARMAVEFVNDGPVTIILDTQAPLSHKYG